MNQQHITAGIVHGWGGHMYGQANEKSTPSPDSSELKTSQIEKQAPKTAGLKLGLALTAVALLVIANTGLLINLTVREDEADSAIEPLAPEGAVAPLELVNVSDVERRDFIYLIQGTQAELQEVLASRSQLTVSVDGPIIAIPDDVMQGASRLHHFDTPRNHVEANPAGPDFYASRPDATLFYTASDGVRRRTKLILGAATWSDDNPESITFSEVEFAGPTDYTSKTVLSVDGDVAKNHIRDGVSAFALEVQLRGVAECGADPADAEECRNRTSDWPITTRTWYLLAYHSHGVDYQCGDTWYWDRAPYPIAGSTEHYPYIENAWKGCRIITSAYWHQHSVYLHRAEGKYKTVRRARVPREGPPRGYYVCPSGCIDINSDCNCDQRCDHSWPDFRADYGCSFEPRLRDVYFINDAEGHPTCAEIGGRQLSDYHECVYMPPQEMTWFAAKTWCENDGGKLAEVYELAENTQLQQLKEANGVGSMWIGARDFYHEGTFVHASSEEMLAYAVWAYHEPNDYGYGEDCVEISGAAGTWNDRWCSTEQRFACQRPTTPPQIQQVVNWLRDEFDWAYRRGTPGRGTPG